MVVLAPRVALLGSALIRPLAVDMPFKLNATTLLEGKMGLKRNLERAGTVALVATIPFGCARKESLQPALHEIADRLAALEGRRPMGIDSIWVNPVEAAIRIRSKDIPLTKLNVIDGDSVESHVTPLRAGRQFYWEANERIKQVLSETGSNRRYSDMNLEWLPGKIEELKCKPYFTKDGGYHESGPPLLRGEKVKAYLGNNKGPNPTKWQLRYPKTTPRTGKNSR